MWWCFNMTYNKEDILNLLKELGIEKISSKEEEILRNKLEFYGSIVPIKKELEVLFALNKVLISSYQKVSIENMDKIDESLDGELMVKLFMEYYKIKERAKDKFSCLEKFKEVAEEILFGRKKVNKQIRDMAIDESNKLIIQEALYMSMLEKKKADSLLNNCLRRSKHFLSTCDGENLKRLIDCLKTNFNLSEDELVKISSRCATFFASSSVSKLNNLYKSLNEFREFVSSRLKVYQDEQAQEALKRDFKDVLMNSSLLATKDGKTVEQTIAFLMGNPVGKIIKISDGFADLKGEFTPSQLARIYDRSITSLGMGVDHIVNFTREISSVYKSIYNKDLNLEGFINGRNFTGLTRLSKIDYIRDGKVEGILRSLSSFFDAENMESLLKNNVAFLECELNDVNKGLAEALMESSNKDDLRKNIISRIRNSFGINDGEFVDVERKKGPGIGKLHKVEIKDIEEENVDRLLSRYGVGKDERERWRSNWNKETKEYRNLEIQINLEDLLEEIESVKSMIPFSLGSVEKFVEEIDLIDEMLKECEDKYKAIVYGKKINKKLSELAVSVEQSLKSTRGEINYNYERVISWYDSELKEMGVKLAAKKETLKDYDKKKQEYEKLHSYVIEHNIDDEYIAAYALDAKALEDVLKNASRIVKKNAKRLEMIEDKSFKMADILDLNYGDFVPNDKIVYKGVELNGEALFIIMNKNFEEMGLLDLDTEGVDFNYPIPSYEKFLSLLSPEEAACVEELKEDWESYNKARIGVLDNLNSLFEHYGREGNPIQTEHQAISDLKELVSQVNEHLSKSRLSLNRSRALEKNLEAMDIENIRLTISGLEENIRTHLEKIEKTKNKIKQ